jgi:outer membrane protein OmpA-like peptidoglycan-associated protein
VAARSAADVRARAYTVGHDVVFAAGQFAPETAAGRRVIAHELAHVVQQTGGSRAPPMVQRLGDVTRVPAGLACPVATDSATNVVTNVLFTIESAGLSPAAIADLATFITSWRAAGADDAVRVDGFASVDGDDPLNWRLSCERAQAVAAELNAPSSGAAGIPSTLIHIFMQGETSEFSAASLPPNRRATISADLSVPPPPPPPACANPGVIRRLDLQPVFLRTGPTDAAPTGASWRRRFNAANTIWGKLGVTFNELSAVTLDTALKTTGASDAEANAIAALRTGPGVEVFLVDNDMRIAGGASTAPGCGASGNIVMSDRGTSDTLLAHELAHTLFNSLQHPPTVGELGTIAQPSGSNNAANSTRNTMVNFAAIRCPAGTGSTCLNPDP